ncbi:O-succinylhomoserine sulfhydrylase [Polynucleobacter paneuropaeus]|jgi:O-succinylhomoserine sulfhydrylase|uniref:O-succinylhomoserine sulfhydrylase n=1 Tax=Polynucleobacter paneuropaeus TaxID=2527775 RepID=UPI001BFE8414|nr:O-succinylhomoserine sulfhydrylase [Polynucleobacter paneuropaeus]MBT8516033.1 O-succinylhomoserine sulfhydrylase [Polynucleobacter paneuropaeus]MBT8519527.1 O-succinylhomoserine sulfhydrylase [Polynucleobacter paneuropaeus]MBT8535115.1 O-succinylhomoserine sulfhydrylase [Polynucleobacter paneuropaeus]MBT8536668.1 O-succinylhomoserine sulfhydrylase [Polynucleobacter paneuropaeus]MBT8554269.1 O-succinylhomoserine sulfhydrylase [Polynucleobacter paneuropaeus]
MKSKSKRPQADLSKLALETIAVRAGTRRTEEFHEHSEALFLTSSFCFDSAELAETGFANADKGFIYSRFTNPTVSMFQDRLAALEGGEACIATSSGMSAILTTAMAHLQAGDHVVCSRSVFGATIQLFSNILSRFGITTTYVDLVDPKAWQSAVQKNTKLFYLETPSNPLTEIADIKAIAAIAKKAKALFVVDNCFCTPALQKPLELGADVVIHSATKYLDGQGRVVGGAIVGKKSFINGKVFPYVRTAGPTLSAFNAWVFLKGLETLELRMKQQSQNALALAQWIEKQPGVERVYHPGLKSHPQHALAKRQQKEGGAILSFVLKGGKRSAFRLINQTKLCSITANLGDTRTTITHPATTTHCRVSPQARKEAGIVDGLVRIAVGLENVNDLINDLKGGFKAR